VHVAGVSVTKTTVSPELAVASRGSVVRA